MKKIRLIFAFVLAGLFLFPSCDDGLFDVIETFTFTYDFPVLTDEAEFTSQSLVDLAADQALISQYGSKIKRIEIQELKYWLKSFNGTETQQLTSLNLSVADPGGSDSQSMIQLQNVNLSSLVNNPTQIPLLEAGKTKLENQVKNPPHTFSYLLSLGLDEVPADFTLTVEVTVKMTANPLN